ncbi:MAG: hypothetical protein IPK74_00095 [Deltaproteobacteria bacterium]|nr:hypothetical protein [Deltaproteobacteria bacterium]
MAKNGVGHGSSAAAGQLNCVFKVACSSYSNITSGRRMIVNRKRNKTRLSKFVAAALTGFMTLAAGASIAWASTTVQVRHRNGTVTSVTLTTAQLASLQSAADCQQYLTNPDCFENPAGTNCTCGADLTFAINQGWIPATATDVFGW